MEDFPASGPEAFSSSANFFFFSSGFNSSPGLTAPLKGLASILSVEDFPASGPEAFSSSANFFFFSSGFNSSPGLTAPLKGLASILSVEDFPARFLPRLSPSQPSTSSDSVFDSSPSKLYFVSHVSAINSSRVKANSEFLAKSITLLSILKRENTF